MRKTDLKRTQSGWQGTWKVAKKRVNAKIFLQSPNTRNSQLRVKRINLSRLLKRNVTNLFGGFKA